uniref:Uncharacterized protein n=1 Tax=Arundo donax TaxID=35708 RepID=A0A0A9BSJ5_ARUDO
MSVLLYLSKINSTLQPSDDKLIICFDNYDPNA